MKFVSLDCLFPIMQITSPLEENGYKTVSYYMIFTSTSLGPNRGGGTQELLRDTEDNLSARLCLSLTLCAPLVGLSRGVQTAKLT